MKPQPPSEEELKMAEETADHLPDLNMDDHAAAIRAVTAYAREVREAFTAKDRPTEPGWYICWIGKWSMVKCVEYYDIDRISMPYPEEGVWSFIGPLPITESKEKP